MSDNDKPGDEGKDPTTPATPEVKPSEPEPAKETDWKAEARKWEDRAKANKAAADKLAEIEEASKTAEQKAAERTAELEAKVKQYESEKQIAGWKSEVEKATGVPAAALAGSTKEEIEAHAETLKPLIAASHQPRIAPKAGTGGGNPPASKADPNALIRAAAKR